MCKNECSGRNLSFKYIFRAIAFLNCTKQNKSFMKKLVLQQVQNFTLLERFMIVVMLAPVKHCDRHFFSVYFFAKLLSYSVDNNRTSYPLPVIKTFFNSNPLLEKSYPLSSGE
jgi:hypothetical protein